MTPLTSDAIERAFIDAALDPLSDHAYLQIASYLEILERWNARMNLTSVRSPEDVLQRHVIECVVAARELPADIESLLDYGSGAGFPGLIFALCRPTIKVTLAEAHAKKASFLREVIRALGLRVDVFAARVEHMPASQIFHAVSMRAVEKMEEAILVAAPHAGRYLALMTSQVLVARYSLILPGFVFREGVILPGSERRIFAIAVPRGTTLE